MTEAAQVAQFHKACTQLLDFRTASMTRNTTDFKAAFKNSMNNEESINLIEKLTLTRADMVQALSQSLSPEEKIHALDNYIPSAFLLMNTLASANPKPTFDKSIIFEWRGSLTPGEEYFKSSDVTYEVIMCLIAKAMLHGTAAKSLVDTDPLSFLTDAGKHLVTASSIMMYVSENINNQRWGRMFSAKAPNPIDVNAFVCKGLSLYFKASAQTMAAVKALNTDSTPALIKARLCVAVINSLKSGIETLNSVTDLPKIGILSHLGMMREIFTGIICWQLAQSYFDKKEMGLCMGYCNASKRCFVEQPSRGGFSGSSYRHNEPGLPKLSGLANVSAAVQVVNAKLDALYKSADSDNRFIYFQVIPTSLPDLPPEANVMNIPTYVEPEYTGTPVVFVYKAPKGIIGSIISSMLGSSDSKPSSTSIAVPEATAPIDNATAPPMAPYAPTTGGAVDPIAQQQADEAYARYLQQQYDKQAAAQAPLPAVAPNGVSYPKL